MNPTNLRAGSGEGDKEGFDAVFEQTQWVLPAGDEEHQLQQQKMDCQAYQDCRNEEPQLDEIGLNVLATHNRASHHETHANGRKSTSLLTVNMQAKTF